MSCAVNFKKEKDLLFIEEVKGSNCISIGRKFKLSARASQTIFTLFQTAPEGFSIQPPLRSNCGDGN